MPRKLIFISVFFILTTGVFALLTSFTNCPLSIVNYSLKGGGIYIDQEQEQKALVFLNKVRKDPNSYSERFGYSLRGIAPRPELQVDDSLTAVAERRAMSMAARGYFSDVDPDGYGINYFINKAGYILSDDLVKHKKESNLEAIEGGAASGEVAIKNIIIDKDKLGEDGKKLLLGIGDFNESLLDVGIGYVHGTGSTKYHSYTCVIIAKRAKPKPSKAGF